VANIQKDTQPVATYKKDVIDEAYYMDRIKKIYPNAYKPRTEADDKKLLKLSNE
jgi:hypothetical protein